jgi:glycosyltransferase involved in cell wall biosynthesis
MKKRNLLTIGTTYRISPMRQKLSALAEYFNVTCVTSVLKDETVFGRPIRDFEDSFSTEGITLIRLPEWPAGKKFTQFFYVGLSDVFRTNQFEVISVDAEPWALYKWQAWWLQRRFQRAAIFGEFTWENVYRPGLRGWILAWVYRVSLRRDDFLIAGNQAAQGILLRHGGTPAQILVAAQHGVDIADFCPANPDEKAAYRRQFGVPLYSMLIGFCGRLVPQKGVAELIAAVEKVRKKTHLTHVHLALVGDGPLCQSIAEKQFDWLHLLPGQPPSTIPAFMKSLDLFVLPSKPLRAGSEVWEEQFGHVLIEAMACEVATFGSSSGAIPEVIGIPEAIFPHSNVGALADLLIRAVLDQEWRLRLAKKQRNRVEQAYSHPVVARQYAEFFQRILDREDS